jgi:hypothetical protein
MESYNDEQPLHHQISELDRPFPKHMHITHMMIHGLWVPKPSTWLCREELMAAACKMQARIAARQ